MNGKLNGGNFNNSQESPFRNGRVEFHNLVVSE